MFLYSEWLEINETNQFHKLKSFFSTKYFLIISWVYLLHLMGFIYLPLAIGH